MEIRNLTLLFTAMKPPSSTFSTPNVFTPNSFPNFKDEVSLEYIEKNFVNRQDKI